ncbi:hypothetical protein HMPREF9088_2041 [Enterococcus italicus DSM 15952]|uniref:Uncharacterized protein n=1 Tax=Enterococcus italicus (strain DSM 15952 / CCUG 50447 / LMG 22039 / TP 1.5) TaxID=888064 RepID=E6LI51_ENTI1|nr:hypothetical protein HMPREF9088_2041 [Enterococcus italicus DSM 15952]
MILILFYSILILTENFNNFLSIFSQIDKITNKKFIFYGINQWN